MRKSSGKRKSMALAAASAPLSGKTVKKEPREVLLDLRKRAGLSAAEVSRALGYKSTNGYIRYEYEEYGDKLIPYPVIKKLLSLFAGRGTPPITADALIMISEARTMPADAPQSTGRAPATQGGALRVIYRVEPGVFLDAALVGTKVYGESGLLPAFDVDVRGQFAAVVSDDPKRTVLHCVRPDQLGVQAKVGKRCICAVPRGNSGLVEVVLRAYDAQGNAPTGSVVGVVIGSYSRE